MSWPHLEMNLNMLKESVRAFEINPDFQRGHVWDDNKQRAYVEFVLRGGKSSKSIYWNCDGWPSGDNGTMVLVDGLQRLTAVRKFMNDELKIFGGNKISDYDDKIDIMKARFRFHVNNLETRAEVLQWYLDINTGGVVHTGKEIEKVKKLLEKEIT